jgi:hypothetical protein
MTSGLIVCLASDEASFIHGAPLPVLAGSMLPVLAGSMIMGCSLRHSRVTTRDHGRVARQP